MSVNPLITNIARCSLHDGPGIRTVVYFKGCNLRCKWCHNPETLFAGKQILFAETKCIHCGKCIEICPDHHKIVGDDPLFLREGCLACGRCAAVCPALALRVCGEEKTTDELFSEIQKDMHYYVSSNGGVTFSGGECLLYPEYLSAIARKCKEHQIHTAVESAFFVPWKNVEKVLPFIDLFYADLKIPDPQKHLQFTGQGNKQIIENIRRLSNLKDQIILRIPVIPGVNDSEEDIMGFASVIKTFGAGITAIELLKYNYLAESKYKISGMKYTKFANEAQSEDFMRAFRASLSEKCGRPCLYESIGGNAAQ